MHVANCPWSRASYLLIIGYAANLMNSWNAGAIMGFKIGDTVQLKSGSPRMTVTVVGMTADGKEVVECAWFDGTQRQNSSFPPDALRDSPVSKPAGPT
jgi:uncharacterized protein YodC (DUF2158 family)